MCGRRRQQQRGLIATALLAGLQDYQSRRSRALPPSTSPSTSTSRNMHHTASFQEPMVQGIAYMAPQYEAPIDPNPPAYEEVPTERAARPMNLVDEKQNLYKLNTEEQVPPHTHEGYGRNTGLDSTPRSIPAPVVVAPYIATSPEFSHRATPNHSSNHSSESTLAHLLEAIALYFDTQIKLNAENPAKTRRLESKKAQKLEKAERKYKEYMEKRAESGKSAKQDEKMERRAEKMEKWTEWVLKKSLERSAQGYDRGAGRRGERHGHAHRRSGHMEPHYQPTRV
ncbi:hypothetical protein ABW20_dc0108218 [Dactylellina cionopaga]|nr:hypothetical protein ABW20_dc0108218 [Dactylellina cionopaga]